MLLKEYSKQASQFLPISTTMHDGRHVLVDSMTQNQVHEAFLLIEDAADDGQGFGQNEYENEGEFLEEIQDGYQFAVMDKYTGEMVACFILAISKYSRGCRVADPYIIVKKSMRGHKLGSFCMDLSLKLAKDLGFIGMYCDTFKNNTSMIRIIEKIPGFELVGSLPMGGFLKDGGIVGTVIYYKDLRPTGTGTERG